MIGVQVIIQSNLVLNVKRKKVTSGLGERMTVIQKDILLVKDVEQNFEL